jgi:hypothetical protein
MLKSCRERVEDVVAEWSGGAAPGGASEPTTGSDSIRETIEGIRCWKFDRFEVSKIPRDAGAWVKISKRRKLQHILDGEKNLLAHESKIMDGSTFVEKGSASLSLGIFPDDICESDKFEVVATGKIYYEVGTLAHAFSAKASGFITSPTIISKILDPQLDREGTITYGFFPNNIGNMGSEKWIEFSLSSSPATVRVKWIFIRYK